MTARSLRLPSQSLSAPENILVIDAVPSAIPSIRPTSAALAPSVETRNTGSSAWIISEETSMKSETNPSAQTVRGTARQPVGGFRDVTAACNQRRRPISSALRDYEDSPAVRKLLWS